MLLAKDTVAAAGFRDAGEAVRMGIVTHLAFEVPDFEAVVARLVQYDNKRAKTSERFASPWGKSL